MSLVYTPTPSVAPFIVCDKTIALICGPIGSTKTTAGLMKIPYHASRMAPCRDGIRRSRAVWVRNTKEQLRDSSIPDFLKWFPDGVAGVYIKTEYKFILRYDDVECEVLFRGLDDANDVRRLLSVQASFGILEEVREINPEISDALQGRLGRYPDGMMVPHRPEWGVDEKGNPRQGCVTDDGTLNKHLWAMTNPPDMDTYWEEYMTTPPSNAEIFLQPGGLSPDADWVQHLPEGYYEDLAAGKTQDWIDIYINGKFGKSLAGRAVYTAFDMNYHVAKGPLEHLRSRERPLIIGMDFGLNPTATINQFDMQGRFLTFDCITSDGMGALRFVQTKLKPLLAERFPACPHIVIGDPAGVQRSQTDERSVFEILKEQGMNVMPARTNNIVARIAAVDSFLIRQIDGQPARLIDPRAKPLINALRGGYRYKTKKNGEHEDSPEKNQYSHPADADQYACLHANVGITGMDVSSERREVTVVSAGGWT